MRSGPFLFPAAFLLRRQLQPNWMWPGARPARCCPAHRACTAQRTGYSRPIHPECSGGTAKSARLNRLKTPPGTSVNVPLSSFLADHRSRCNSNAENVAGRLPTVRKRRVRMPPALCVAAVCERSSAQRRELGIASVRSLGGRLARCRGGASL